VNKDIINKYFKGKCNAEEAAAFLRWLNSEKADQELNAYLKDCWIALEDEKMMKPQVLEKLNSIIDEKQKTEKTATNGNLKTIFRIAASLALFLMVSWSVYHYININENLISTNTIQEETLTFKSTGKGQKLKIKLPDGSHVMLNSASDISYPEVFSDSVREVHLIGEAFFEVEKSKTPFVVRTGEVTTTVLGTSFNVRHRVNEHHIEVALLSGRVNVDNNEIEEVQLLPGDRIAYDKMDSLFSLSKYNYKKDFAWKDGILHFEYATINKIKEKLENWYGVQIEIENDNNDLQHFTGSFNNESLDNVLESLSFTFGFKYLMKEKDVYIQF